MYIKKFMHISDINTARILTTQTASNAAISKQNISFRGENDRDCFVRNFNAVDHIELTPDKKKLKSVYFRSHTSLKDALRSLGYTKNSYLKTCLTGRLHPAEEFQMMYKDIVEVSEIADIQIKSLMSMGCSALVFETTDGNILKLTPHNHFPGDRNQERFDLPCTKKGKSGDTYFYIQEKVSQEDLTQKEIETLVEKIQELGYQIQDYLRANQNSVSDKVRKEQFGKTKDGRIYLIDPGCAIKNTSAQNDDSLNLCNKINKFFNI